MYIYYLFYNTKNFKKKKDIYTIRQLLPKPIISLCTYFTYTQCCYF